LLDRSQQPRCRGDEGRFLLRRQSVPKENRSAGVSRHQLLYLRGLQFSLRSGDVFR
jgi:hypothetical protein